MPKQAVTRQTRILLALDEPTNPNPDTKAEMVRLYQAAKVLAVAQHAVNLTVLGLVQVSEGQSLSEGTLAVQAQRILLDEIINAPGASEIKPNSKVNLTISAIVRVTSETTVAQELNDAIIEHQATELLLGWQWFEDETTSNINNNSTTLQKNPIDEVLKRPLCDVAIIGPGVDLSQTHKIMLAARGGPFAELALRLAGDLAEQNDGQVTLLHVVRDELEADTLEVNPAESPYQELARSAAGRKRIRRKQVVSTNPQEAIVQESQHHDLILLGATVNSSFDPVRTEALLRNPFGPVATAVLEKGWKSQKNNEQPKNPKGPSVIIVRAGAPQDFYFAQLQRRQQRVAARQASEDYVTSLVDKWFAENTFDAKEFADIERLVASKKSQNLTISLCLPALNEEATIGDVITSIKSELYDKYHLLDEIILIDSSSTDRTVEIAKELGIPVHVHQEILPEQGNRRGKGEALWKSLYVAQGDIIVWIDTDIKNPDPRFVYGLIGPLLKEQRIQYVKGYYRRPIQVGDTTYETGGGRVTELNARPLFNLFFPELSGIIQPLAGEYAGRRTCLEQLPFFTGYGVETGHLLDLLERFGLAAIGQVNLSERRHRNQELGALSQMAFAITQVIINRLEDREKLRLIEEINRKMRLIRLGEEGLYLDTRYIEDYERPAMIEIPEYRQKNRKRLARSLK
jgi:glucosyl-3-phosphoglycerate synthase